MTERTITDRLATIEDMLVTIMAMMAPKSRLTVVKLDGETEEFTAIDLISISNDADHRIPDEFDPISYTHALSMAYRMVGKGGVA